MVDPEAWRPDLARKAELILEQERESYRRLLGDVYARIEAEGDTGLWAIDCAVASKSDGAQAGLVGASEHVQRLAHGVDDAAETLTLMFQHGRLLWLPALTLSRQILEAVMQTCWLMDPAVTPQMRVARAATLRPAFLNESITLLARFRDEAELAEKQEVRRQLVRLLLRDGLQVEFVKAKDKPTEKVARVAFDGASAPTRLNMTGLLDTYLAVEDRWLYGLLSGAAHAKGWLLEGGTDDPDQAIRSIVLPLLQISDVYAKAWCGYFGVDVGPYRRKTATRRMAIIRTGSPGSPPPVGAETAFGRRSFKLLGD